MLPGLAPLSAHKLASMGEQNIHCICESALPILRSPFVSPQGQGVHRNGIGYWHLPAAGADPGLPGRQRCPGAGGRRSSPVHHEGAPAGWGLSSWLCPTKHGGRPPGICPLSRGYVPGDRVALRGFVLSESRDRPILVDWVGAELPALAPDDRCPVGCSVGSGHLGPGREQWHGLLQGCCNRAALTRQEHHNWSERFEQGPDRERAPGWCAEGEPSIDGASQSRSLHEKPA
jgi:hypothetical protein